MSSKDINFSSKGVKLLRSFCSTKGETMSGGPKGTPKMERSDRRVIGIAEGEEPERRGQGDERELSNQMNSHLAAFGKRPKPGPFVPSLLQKTWGANNYPIVQIPKI